MIGSGINRLRLSDRCHHGLTKQGSVASVCFRDTTVAHPTSSTVKHKVSHLFSPFLRSRKHMKSKDKTATKSIIRLIPSFYL